MFAASASSSKPKEDGMDVQNALMDLAFVFPVSLVVGYFCTRMLDMERPALFMAVVAASGFVLNLFRAGFTPPVKLLSGFAFDVLLPIAMSRGPLPKRVLVVSLMQVAIAADEIVGTMVWLLLANAPSADYGAAREHFGAFVLMHAVHMVVLVALLACLEAALKRRRGETEAVPLGLFAGFPATQFALLIMAVFLGYYHYNDSVAYYAVCSFLMLAALAVDALFLRTLHERAKAQAEKERLAAVETRMNDCYEHYARVVDVGEKMAKFRHDARNQLQVVRALAESGDYDAACDHARALEALLKREGRTGDG